MRVRVLESTNDCGPGYVRRSTECWSWCGQPKRCSFPRLRAGLEEEEVFGKTTATADSARGNGAHEGHRPPSLMTAHHTWRRQSAGWWELGLAEPARKNQSKQGSARLNNVRRPWYRSGTCRKHTSYMIAYLGCSVSIGGGRLVGRKVSCAPWIHMSSTRYVHEGPRPGFVTPGLKVPRVT
jgi:hypothetical protein